MYTRGLYAYVGNRATGYSTLGGSSSILAKVPLSSLTLAQLQTLTPGESVYLIGGGGGGGGDASNDAPWHFFNGGAGGAANKACANVSAPLPGPAVSAGGSNGTGGGGDCGVGKGGNPNGKGYGGASTGTGAGGRGIGGWGLSNQWRSGGSLVFVNTPAPSGGSPTGQGVSSRNYGGAGGGGWGGGGSGDSCSGSGAAGSGAGGGGTFAAGNTAYDANAPKGGTDCTGIPPVPSSPSPGGYGAIQFAYAGDALALPGALKSSTHETPGECLTAPNEQGIVLQSTADWRFFWQDDANLVLLDADWNPKWASGSGKSGDQLCFQTDGNLVIYTGGVSTGQVRWGSKTGDDKHGGNGGRRMAFDGPCDVAILNADNQVLWSTGTSCD
jgi:hypothetical protein